MDVRVPALTHLTIALGRWKARVHESHAHTRIRAVHVFTHARKHHFDAGEPLDDRESEWLGSWYWLAVFIHIL